MTQIWLTFLVIISEDACRRGCVISTPTPKARPLLRQRHNVGHKELDIQYHNRWYSGYDKELNGKKIIQFFLPLVAVIFYNSEE